MHQKELEGSITIEPTANNKKGQHAIVARISRSLVACCAAFVIALTASAAPASASAAWSGYSQLGSNQVKAVAATSPAAGRIDLFAIGTDNAVRTKRSHNYGLSYSDYTQVAPNVVRGITAAAAATTAQTYELNLLVVGTDNAAWNNRLSGCSTRCI